MPELEGTQKTVEIPNQPEGKDFRFKKTKFFTYSVLSLVFALGLVVSSYFVGFDSGKSQNQPVLTKTTKEQIKKTDNVVEATLGDRVKVKSGIEIKLEEAVIDQNYENQKAEQKKYYASYASQSAYLASDYFKQSYLKIKVSLTNTNPTTISYNPGDFRLKDSQDVQYVYSVGENKTLYNLTPNETTKISLSYYVPSDEKNFKLIFENAVISFVVK